MKIFAKDHPSWIEIKRFVDEANQYSSYEISAAIDISHGQFTAKNIDVHFLNVVEFQSELNSFITNKSIVPRLEGTYDTYLEFAGTSNSVLLRFKIGDAFCGTETINYLLEGAFEVSQESLLNINTQLAEIAIDA
jgi:hypothetical protein